MVNIVHYMHVNKLWYYWIDNSEQKKYYRKIQCEDDLKDVILLSDEVLTERQAKKLLQQLFPDNRIIKAIPYHESSSLSGSRPVKTVIDRKRMLKEKLKFMEELK